MCHGICRCHPALPQHDQTPAACSVPQQLHIRLVNCKKPVQHQSQHSACSEVVHKSPQFEARSHTSASTGKLMVQLHYAGGRTKPNRTSAGLTNSGNTTSNYQHTCTSNCVPVLEFGHSQHQRQGITHAHKRGYA